MATAPTASRPRSAARRRRLDALATLLLILLAAAAGFDAPRAQKRDAPTPQPTPQGQEIDEDEVLKIDTDLVLVDVLVADAEGRPVHGLRPEDFRVYDDGEERELAFFHVERRGGEERPVAVVFLVDVSGSMTPEEMERVRTAMEAFARGLAGRPASFALMSFGMSAKVQQNFTGDFSKLNRAVARLARELNGLSTHTYDAVDDAVRLLVRQGPRTLGRQVVRRAVVVVTDGFPVGDTVHPKTVIERANAAGVSVYAVTLPSYSRQLASRTSGPLPTPLDVSGLLERTGGANFYADSKDYTPLFRALAEEVTSSYVLAFYPPEEKRRDGRQHAVRVEAPPGLRVRQSRTEYKGSDK